MFLKRIEINGFKSFANKTEILLNNRITGIVGPNGSGKSNIADAIRWVLGEQSSKNLRGTKMEDVIFNGTQSRAKKPFCEVSLIFDNEDGKINSEYAEITITRKMFRNGESEYKINNASVRLKDVIDITRDTGIGKEGYSIIGQGKIDEILSSKPLQRRRVFEEAAGIMKYRARKEESERKLEKTDENLTRVEDILEELNSRLEPLKVQAEQTRKYLALFDRQRVLDANIFLLNNGRFGEKAKKLSIEISQVEGDINRLMREFGDISLESDKLNEQLDEAIEKENELNEKASNINGEIERLLGQANLIEEKIKNIESEIFRTNDEIQAFSQGIEELKASMNTKEEKLEEITDEISICDEELSVLEAKRDELTVNAQAHLDKISKIKAHQLDLMSQGSSRKSELARLSAEKEGSKSRIEDIESRLQRVIKDKEQRQKLVQNEQARIRQINEDKLSIARRINENNAVIANEKQTARELEEEYNSVMAKLTDGKGRLKLMTDLKNEYEGYNDSVRNLMKAVKSRPEHKRKIIGTVAELIHVPKEYETAIETFLGGSLQNIVVKDEYAAKDLIELLREEKLGRVTFLPVDALKVSYFSAEDMRKLKNHEGYIASAHEVIKYGDNVAPAIEFLLSKTALTKDLDSSIKIMRSFDQTIKTLTLSGDIMRPGGIMTGGSVNKKNFGLLSRERLMSEMETLVKEYEARAEKQHEAMLLQQKVIDDLKAAASGDIEELKKLDISLAESRERVASYTSLIEGCEANERTLKNQISAEKMESQAMEEDCEKLSKLIAYLEAQAKEVEASLAELEQGNTDNSKEINRLSEEINGKKIRKAELSKENQAFNAERDRLTNEINRDNLRIEAKNASVQNLLSQNEGLKAELLEMRRLVEDKREELEMTKEISLEAGERRKDLRALVVEKQKQSSDFQEQRTMLMEKRVKLESQLERVNLALENAQTKLWEDYELTYASAESLKIEINYTNAVKEVEDVRSKIRALGSINPNAIEEFEEVNGRATQMQLQRDDLIKAKEDLAKVIDNLMSNMKTTFEERFDQINENFKRIFKELFGGGRAELYFEEGDILEAGIEIAAEPPGKKLQQLSLLSGGERALTAIALLFAMIKINPSPVCLLDEIDAPLDEANAVQFASYLTKINETQFMVITHRKPTMTACNALYGVTMEEKGVSRMVSVQIDNQ